MVFFDIIQSYVIKGIIILIILKAMLLLQDLLYEYTEKANLEGELSTATFTFASDMRLAGLPNWEDTSATYIANPITIAETSRVNILGDIDTSGSVDNVTYSLDVMPSSSKFYLKRTVNGGTPLIVGKNFRQFYLTYYDSLGRTPPVSSIKSIFIKAKMENDVQFNGQYLTSFWQTQIFPPNLNK